LAIGGYILFAFGKICLSPLERRADILRDDQREWPSKNRLSDARTLAIITARGGSKRIPGKISSKKVISL
jgi:hypothetical protein